MNTSPTKSSPTLALSADEERMLETLLYPMHMSLILATIMLGGGALISAQALTGAVPGTLASMILGWAGVWLSSVVGFVSLMGLFFVKPLALKLIALSRAKNVPVICS